MTHNVPIFCISVPHNYSYRTESPLRIQLTDNLHETLKKRIHVNICRTLVKIADKKYSLGFGRTSSDAFFQSTR